MGEEGIRGVLMKKILFLICFFMFAFGGENLVDYRLNLSKFDSKDDLKVEVIFAKEILVDCNRHFLSGGNLVELEQKSGDLIYKFDDKAILASTRMMCPDDKKELKLVNFSFSKVFDCCGSDVIIKTPKDVIVKYKIYKKISEENAEVAR